MLQTYKTYYHFLLKYKLRCILFAIALVIYSIIQSIQPYFYKLFVDAIPNGNNNILFNILIIYIAVRLLEVVLDVATFWLGDWALIDAARDARLKIFKKIQDLDFAYHLNKSTGSLISIFKRGDLAYFTFHHVVNIQITKIIISFFVVIAFFAQVNSNIAWLMIASFVLNLFIAYFLIKRNVNARKKFNDEEDNISSIIVDNLINYETVKLFAKEDKEYKRLTTKFKPWTESLWGYANTFRIIDITIGSISNIGLFFILLIGIIQLTNTTITSGQFIMILGFISTFYPRFFQLIYELRNLAKQHADLEKYFEILTKKTKIKDPQNPIIIPNPKGEIEFKDVTFTYQEKNEPAIQNLNFKIRQGQSIALVGASGGGKTTVTKLLMRFFDPESGKILIDNIDIKDLTKSHLRSLMGVVPQEPILFNNTIEYNIGYGSNKKPTQEEIHAAATQANLQDFIDDLPKGYQTMVGERGIKLSGGQKQRLAIARMILANPHIIIFDEATSQLDSQSEKLIQDAFWKASKNKTTIIIAHRLSTVTRADKILVIDNGQIIESGSHHELINKKNSLYNKFWRLQINNSDK